MPSSNGQNYNISNHTPAEETIATKDAALTLLQESGIAAGQKYQHFKTGDVYVVIAVGLFEASCEPVVVYCRDGSNNSAVWVRFLGNFRGRALKDGGLVQRFSRVDA